MPIANCGENRVKREGDGKMLPPPLRALRRIEHWYSSFANPCNPRLGRVGGSKLCCAAPPISYLLLNRTCHGRKQGNAGGVRAAGLWREREGKRCALARRKRNRKREDEMIMEISPPYLAVRGESLDSLVKFLA